MNNELFQRARQEYSEGNFEGALQAYTDCLQDNPTVLAPGEIGLLYHQIGNCLVKLNDYDEAIHAYTQATTDSSYQAASTVNYNLGMAYAALHDYEDSVKHFEIAVSDAKYETPYKAYLGMGNAYLKLGNSVQAGSAFRRAALDESNPNPTKALLNLGICFMTLNRPSDAVSSYESALQFDMDPKTRNKIYANLGQAYVAAGKMQNAVSAFEHALADKSYFLSDSASVDYQRAIAAVSTGADKLPEVAPAAVQPETDMSGLDVRADGSPLDADPSEVTSTMDPYYYPETYVDENGYTSENAFFDATPEQLDEWSKQVVKRSRRGKNRGLKVLAFFVALIILAFAGGVVAYTQGYGFPTQTMVVEQLFNDPSQAKSQVFAKGISEEKAEGMVNMLATKDAHIEAMSRSMTTSEVYVKAKTDEGGEVQYQVTLVRDLVGWKVSSVDLYFPSAA